MTRICRLVLLLLCLHFITSCNGQVQNNTASQTASATNSRQRVGGPCEGCELMYAGMPSNINTIDTSEGWKEEGQKFLLSGTVYKRDGKTVAPGVIIYYYHADNKGYYSPRPENQEAKRHGHLRGWVKTDVNGEYSIYTIRPVSYPNSDIPAHIHVLIKEPNINEYYIDELVFDDDKFLTPQKRTAFENRGGNGFLKTFQNDNILVAKHNIILGLNIPNHPDNKD